MAERISRKKVDEMFNGIAPSYDSLNHLLSVGIDRSWRRKAVRAAGQGSCSVIADFATGTGDLAIYMAGKLAPRRIYGLDFSEGMLAVAREKIERRGLQDVISLSRENCEHTSLGDASVDVVTCSFGIRNFNDPQAGLCEMMRILKPGSRAVILEFATPRKGPVASFAKWYYTNVIPFLGKLLAGNKSAYRYLPATIYEFACGETFCGMMRAAGFEQVSFKSLSFNMVNLYTGVKPQ